MIRLNRILLPTDFSEFSRAAANYACELAHRFEAELHLLHATQPLTSVVLQAGLAQPPSGNYSEEIVAEAERSLRSFLDPDWSEQHTVEYVLRTGTAFVEIVQYARDTEIDLIVLTTHGRSALTQMLIGGTAELVVRKASCPVMTVRPEGHQFVMP